MKPFDLVAVKLSEADFFLNELIGANDSWRQTRYFSLHLYRLAEV